MLSLFIHANISPTPNSDTATDVPPSDMKGSGSPFRGTKPTTPAMFHMLW